LTTPRAQNITSMNFVFPEKPVDLFELVYFTAEDYGVVEYRLLYHVDSKWDDVYPESKGGADLTDDWQVFRNGSFTGRYSGWPLKSLGDRPRYTTRAEAMTVARAQLERSIAMRESELAEKRARFAEMVAALTTPASGNTSTP